MVFKSLLNQNPIHVKNHQPTLDVKKNHLEIFDNHSELKT